MQAESEEGLIVIEDCKEVVLSQSEWKATDDYRAFPRAAERQVIPSCSRTVLSRICSLITKRTGGLVERVLKPNDLFHLFLEKRTENTPVSFSSVPSNY